MSAAATNREQQALLRQVAEMQPVEFMPLRDAFRRRHPEISAHGVRNMLVALMNRDLIVFGLGPRRMSYALGDVSSAMPLERAPAETVFWPDRLLYTLEKAGRDVASAEIAALYPEARVTKLFDTLNDLYDRGQIEREGGRGRYRYRFLQLQHRLTPAQIRQRRLARKRNGPVVRAIAPARPEETPAVHPAWASPPAPEFGRPDIGLRCALTGRIAA